MSEGVRAEAVGALARGTPPGSLRHFAVLYGASPARPLIEAVYAFESEIAATTRTTSHEAAHTRLQWWRGEVDRLLAGRPQHPVTHALQPLRDVPGADLGLLHEALVAADIDLARLTLANDAELEAYCFRAAGSLQTLIAHAAAGTSPLTAAAREFARLLGSGVRQAEMLRDLRLDLAAGRMYLPLARLERAGIDPTSVRPDTDSPALLEAIEAWRRSVRSELLELPRLLDATECAAQRQGLVLAALHVRLLERLDHRRGLSRIRAQVPPWTRLWTAWRTAVRYA
jgi:phytoene synthase